MIKPIIAGLGTCVPEREYSQADILHHLGPHFGTNPHAPAIFAATGVGTRRLVADYAYYDRERSTYERNQRYLDESIPLGERAIERCLAAAALAPGQVTDFVVVSCTGLDIPGLDLRLAGRLGLRPELHRSCILGIGCYAAFPALREARDIVLARPAARVLVLAVELCSLHFQVRNASTEQVVSSALFADGAAAVLVADGAPGNGAAPRPALLDSATYSDYQTFDHMAFHLTDNGFLMRLSPRVPDVLAENVEPFVDGLLRRHGLSRADVRHWAVHPGSAKILDRVGERLGLPGDALDASRVVLRDLGNMSSPTVLFVLDEIQRRRRPAPGDYGVLLGFGPGLTLEGALVRW